MIIFDGIDRGSSDLIQILSAILTLGGYRSPDTNKTISFQNTVVVMTTTKATGCAVRRRRSL